MYRRGKKINSKTKSNYLKARQLTKFTVKKQLHLKLRRLMNRVRIRSSSLTLLLTLIREQILPDSKVFWIQLRFKFWIIIQKKPSSRQFKLLKWLRRGKPKGLTSMKANRKSISILEATPFPGEAHLMKEVRCVISIKKKTTMRSCITTKATNYTCQR